MNLTHIYLYNGTGAKNFRLNEIKEYLKKTIGKVKIILCKDFISHYLLEEKEHSFINTLAQEIAKSKIRDIQTQELNLSPLPIEIEYEKKNLFYATFGIMYDGFRILPILANLIPRDKFKTNISHIIFTNQLFGTWDKNDKRYHARVSVYGFPSIISTTGIVEAPARPREYYLKQRIGINRITLEKEFRGRFINYDDERLTEVMKGYAMQAIFFHLTGNPFCENKKCRLYNAHWQEEVIEVQLINKRLCNRHQQILNRLQSLS